MRDVIERQAAIDAICDEFSEVYCNNCDHKSDDGDCCEDCHRKYMNWAASRETVERVLKALPSAQPEPCDDAVSRKDATKELFVSMIIKSPEFGDMLTSEERSYNSGLREAVKIIKKLPSVTLKPQECKDTISRQAAIDALAKHEKSKGHNYTMFVDVVSECAEIIRDLPSAQPEQRWIPWDSGKFPKESGTYTVTACDGVTKRVTYVKYQKRLKRWELTGTRAYWRVLAWMPLPEPWEGEQDG